MNNELIKETVYKFAKLSKISDQKVCDKLIDRLSKMPIEDAMDTIIVSLNSLLNRGVLTQNDIFLNADMLLALDPEKYKSPDDLVSRLRWIQSMNMEHLKMPLSENHKLVLETFDEFNNLIGDKFDCFYTGGLMGYLATNHELERYHDDLDLFINEQQLGSLRELVDQSDDFEFVSNMDHKDVNGHEYEITYKGTPMNIGLFLFERLPDDSITTKEYYYDGMDPKSPMHVDEHHLSKAYTDMMIDTSPKFHNGISYKMQSLESIYNAKKNSRPKDKYDASIIKPYVDMSIDSQLDAEDCNNYDITHIDASDSVVAEMEQQIHCSSNDKDLSDR